ncbi:MAG: terminase gpA endonuclease subunit, partial [Tepidisphaeraceae bacterium]
MDAVTDPVTEEIVVCKGAQIGYSECVRNCIGFWIDLQPGPCLIVNPDQKSAEDFSDECLTPLLENSPALVKHQTHRARDRTVHRMRLDTMSIFLAWAASSAGLKRRPIRYLILEEPDDYVAFSGAGGDPIAKAEKRVTTYGDKGQARKLIGGTPSTKRGNIWKRLQNCAEIRYFWIPCPHCDKYQRLVWGGAGDGPGVKWPDIAGDRAQQADQIEQGNLAYYQCEHCKGEIRDHHKPGMLRRGVWASEDQAVTPDGRVVGPRKQSKRVGFHISSLYSPWVAFGKLTAEWLLAQDDRQALIDFINQRLAEPYETTSAEIKLTAVEAKANGAPPALIVPKWATRLIATADTQGTNQNDGYFYYVIRAWGTGWRSQLIDAGVVSTSDELRAACFGRTFDYFGQTAQVQYLLIDSGGPRWNEIYSLALSDPARIKPTKGANRKLVVMVDRRHQKEHGVTLWEIDTRQSKDQLHLLIHHDDPTLWAVNDRATPDYLKQLTAEHKIVNAQGVELWELKPGRPANHFLDCEQQQVAAAWAEGCGMSAPAQDTPQPQSVGEPRVSPSQYMQRDKRW